MSVSMDVVFCVDNSSSMLVYSNKIRENIVPISGRVLQIQGDVRIGLIKFPSAGGLSETDVYGFTTSKNIVEQWLCANEPSGGRSDGYEPIGDALNAALNIGWRANIGDEIPNKKIVVLITDGPPDGLRTPLIGADPWVISDRFIEQGITLVVVGVGESIIECDDFYCSLAEKTGGKYIPMVNFERIIPDVLVTAFRPRATFRDAFRYVIIEEIEKDSSFKYSNMKSRVDGMINECKTMADIQNFFSKHGRPHI